jgi:nicotinate-nucleotide adenylyltransferase
VNALGILGGSFNPPHLGHLALARDAIAELSLDRLLMVPVCFPPHKPPAADDPGPEHRLAMCRALADGVERLDVSTLEIDRGGRSYTIDTLEDVHASHPDAELTLILGADMACTLPTWRRPSDILKLAQVAVAERGSDGADRAGSDDGVATRERVLEVLRSLDPEARVRMLSMPPVPVSSTIVRERLSAGEPVEDLVGHAVASYIAEHGLYAAPRAVLR